ncbi:hypothetical protein SAMN05421837_105262 [Amycolatopsis pretoriensis]|uniref:Uncharacterized protein n=1 Tax=Amycolatopsis pretoriensis TaxID=218821 RepID=A0A1H5QXI1_9PSEU|nr:hypothetical protein [Amycolatopsis pretoriensis]SEF30524.1 hypothetical protein SAMN05421837_105262 [Amycolatopsis pretoriensis]
MNDQPREVPEGTEKPTVEQPTAQSAADQPTTQQPAQGAGETTTLPNAAQGEPAAQPPAATTALPNAAQAGDQTAAHGQQPPPGPSTPQLSQPGPGQAYGAWGPPAAAAAPRQPGGFRRFVGHRATQLVGVGVLGLLIGGGIVGGIAAATHHGGGPRDGRPGIHRQYNGPDGNQGRGFPGRGGGNSGNSGDGNGI